MKALNQNEEKVMHIFWKLKEGVIRDVWNQFPEPRPPYTTVSSIVKKLKDLEYLDCKVYGKKMHLYFPKVSKTAYRKQSFNEMITNFFGGSAKKVVSFLVEEEQLSPEEIAEIQALIEQQKQQDQ